MRSKKKAVSGAVKVSDVIFGTLVHDATATVVAEQGMVVLKVADDPQPFFLPEGVVLPASAYGEEVNITIRDITREVILELGEDDFYEEDLESDARLMPVDNWSQVKSLYEEAKIRTITRNSKSFSTCLAGVALSCVCAFLLRKGFSFTEVCYAGIVGGVLLAAVCMIKSIRELFTVLKSETLCDSVNNCINITTGCTNLNGGIRIPSSQRNDWREGA